MRRRGLGAGLSGRSLGAASRASRPPLPPPEPEPEPASLTPRARRESEAKGAAGLLRGSAAAATTPKRRPRCLGGAAGHVAGPLAPRGHGEAQPRARGSPEAPPLARHGFPQPGEGETEAARPPLEARLGRRLRAPAGLPPAPRPGWGSWKRKEQASGVTEQRETEDASPAGGFAERVGLTFYLFVFS